MYLFPANPHWKTEYVGERNSILSAYGSGIELFHIGSTAVDGLNAKDCIDIVGVVNNINQVKIEVLICIGYKHKGEFGVAGREYFSKSMRKVHLHVFEKGNPEIAKHLNFVKVMSMNPDLVIKLNSLKNYLHSIYPDNKEQYQKEKIHFYNEIHKML